MSRPQIDIGIAGKQFLELQPLLPDDLHQHLLIKIVQIQNADLALKVAYILHNVVCGRLVRREFIAVHPCFLYSLHKRFDRKRIVLHGHTELFLALLLHIARLKDSVLVDHLSGVPQKLLTLRCDDDSPVRAHKNLQPDLLLQFLYRLGQTGLR